jgi:SpoVK/Ycf46/Vps4 family AAA+-type ATPase
MGKTALELDITGSTSAVFGAISTTITLSGYLLNSLQADVAIFADAEEQSPYIAR